MTVRKTVALSLLIAVTGVLLTLIIWRGEQPVDKAMAFPRGQIIVGVDASFPPFASDDGRSLYGLDIDLAKAIARRIDMPIRFISIGYYGLYDALISGQVDMLVSALSVDVARMDDVRYTRHYFDNGLLVVNHEGLRMDSLNQLAGLRVAYEIGSLADGELRALERDIGPVQRLPYEMPRYALDSLRLNHADAAIVDATSLRLYSKEHPDWDSEHRYLTHELYAIAVRKDRRETWSLIDEALAALQEDGEIATILSAWL